MYFIGIIYFIGMIVCHSVGDLYKYIYIYIYCLIWLVLRDLSQPDIFQTFSGMRYQSMDSGAGNLGLRSLSDRDDNTLSIYLYI